jgi:hypothetical protein
MINVFYLFVMANLPKADEASEKLGKSFDGAGLLDFSQWSK